MSPKRSCCRSSTTRIPRKSGVMVWSTMSPVGDCTPQSRKLVVRNLCTFTCPGRMARTTSSIPDSCRRWHSSTGVSLRTSESSSSALDVPRPLCYVSHIPHSCQCGISRSATMVIAYVMRAAKAPDAPPHLAKFSKEGMHGAYNFVKAKSSTIGPNMS